MKAKILFDTDLHKKYADPESIKGYGAVTDLIQSDRLRYILNNGITHYIHGGDLYDRGYFDTGRVMNDNNWDRAISAAVNGNAYLCIGNHIFLERDANPELYLIQPNTMYKPSRPFVAFSPIYKAVPKIRIGTVQISFMHFNKEELYVPVRDEDTTYHICIYHTDRVLPTSFRLEAGYHGEASSDYLEMAYRGVDLALVAHVHVPLGVRKVNNTTVIIPGSAMVTKNDDREKHKTIELPIITIDDDDKVQLELVPFSTHIENLKFHTTRSKKKKEKEDILLRSKESKEAFHEVTTQKTQTLMEFLTSRGYDQKHLNLIERASVTTLDKEQIHNILNRSDL